MKVRDYHSGGTCPWQSLEFVSTKVDKSVYLLLQNLGGEHIFYVMPNDKSYEIQTAISEGGAEDMAGNEFDADPTTDESEKISSVKFRILTGGEVEVLGYSFQ
jgi:hypothetical protein